MADVIISDLNAGTVTSTTMIPASLTSAASTSATVFVQPKDFAQVLSLSSVAAGTVGSTSLLFGTVTTSSPVVFQANSILSAANVFALGVGTVTSSSLIAGGNTSSGALSFAAGSIGQVTNIIGLTTGSVNVSSSTLLIGAPTSSGNVSIPVGALPFSTGGTSAVGTYRVTGLVGVNSTSTPTTQFQVNADVVELWKPSDNSKKFVVNTTAIINNILTTAANGRDQAGAFTASNWIHLYFVGNDTVTSSTLATRTSLVAPPTGPTLPTSETRWAYAGALRLNGSTQLLPARFRGPFCFFNTTDGNSDTRILSAGHSTSFAPIDCSSVIPPNSQMGIFDIQQNVTSSNQTLSVTISNVLVRPSGSTETGQPTALCAATGSRTYNSSIIYYPVSSSQSLDYANDGLLSTPTGGEGAYIDAHGFYMPNGGG